MGLKGNANRGEWRLYLSPSDATVLGAVIALTDTPDTTGGMFQPGRRSVGARPSGGLSLRQLAAARQNFAKLYVPSLQTAYRGIGEVQAGSVGTGTGVGPHSLEAQFRQAQKLESVGKLAGVAAHDFKNVLNVVYAYSTHLLEHMDSSDAAYTGLTEIRKAAEQGATLTHQLLTLSRKEKTHPRHE